MSTTHNKIAMSPEELPRQRLFQLLELPEQPEGFELLCGDALRNLRPEEPGEGASLIVQAEWAWSLSLANW